MFSSHLAYNYRIAQTTFAIINNLFESYATSEPTSAKTFKSCHSCTMETPPVVIQVFEWFIIVTENRSQGRHQHSGSYKLIGRSRLPRTT